MIQQIFFQSSLPRAGSTLLQNIVGQNPDFYVTPTSGVLELLYGARNNYTTLNEFKAQDPELMKSGFLSFCRFGLKGFYEGVTDKAFVLDKSRGWGIHYNFLASFYPEGNPKIICMIRDPREVFSSMEKNFRKHQYHDHSNIVNHGKLQGTTTHKRVEIWSNSTPVGMAFERINQIILEGIDKKILFIKFENLTSNPEEQMKRVYEYLNLPYFQHDFNDIKQITQEDDSIYGIFGDHNIRHEIKPVPKTSKEILGKQTCDFILNKYSWFFNHFKYIP
jgi:sulfotransferase